MCGIIVKRVKNMISFNDHFVKRRGQDGVGTAEKDGFYFTHYLLSITGEFSPQPYVKDDIIMVYNGEIYNHSFEKSDGEVIIPLYEKYGMDFPKHLDGEFAIALYDFRQRIIIMVTDPFGTKPLWIDEVECASYASALGRNATRIPPNSIVVTEMDTGRTIEVLDTHKFDFNNQTKTSYKDWIKAFKQAVRKRWHPNCFIGLSSGYDSGGIMRALLDDSLDFKTYSVLGEENREVLSKRLELAPMKQYIIVSESDKARMKSWLFEQVEEFPYRIKVNGEIRGQGLHSDKASVGFGLVCEAANAQGYKVHLSGQGADEIMTDYKTFPSQSELKGVFPKDLKEWFNFRDGCMYSYLGKEEYVGGSFNIESRYPFLDKQVVQEWLWLSPELKNEYKGPLKEYFESTGFPFAEGQKVGFRL